MGFSGGGTIIGDLAEPFSTMVALHKVLPVKRHLLCTDTACPVSRMHTESHSLFDSPTII